MYRKIIVTRKRFIQGRFVRILLPDGSYGYGRLRELPIVSFYGFHTEDPVSGLEEIASNPILFTVGVHKSVLDRWDVIGIMPLEEQMQRPFLQFWQDINNYRNCRIFDVEGNERTATPDECEGLERWAVWEAGHIEERVLDTLMGRPSKWTEQMKVRHEDHK